MKWHRVWAVAVSAVGIAAGFSAAGPAFADELYDYGEYLSSECTACHRLGGEENAIPSITGWPIDAFVTVMESYRDGVQENEAMLSVVKSLSKEDIEALAVFFQKQE